MMISAKSGGRCGRRMDVCTERSKGRDATVERLEGGVESGECRVVTEMAVDASRERI